MRLAKDASGHQFLDQIMTSCVGRLVSTTDITVHFVRLIKEANIYRLNKKYQ